MKQGGYNETYRRRITEGIIAKYQKQVIDHQDGNIMYRNKTEMKEMKKHKSSALWFKARGNKYTVQVPATEGQILGKRIKNSLQIMCGEKFLLQEKFGLTTIGTLTKSNPCPPPQM